MAVYPAPIAEVKSRTFPMERRNGPARQVVGDACSCLLRESSAKSVSRILIRSSR